MDDIRKEIAELLERIDDENTLKNIRNIVEGCLRVNRYIESKGGLQKKTKSKQK